MIATPNTTTLQTPNVQELSDEQLERVNGGFFWFLLIPVVKKLVTVAAYATAGHFLSQGTKKSAKTLGASDEMAEVIGEVVGTVV